MIRGILASSRFFILVAVLGSFLASSVALVFAGISTIVVAVQTFKEADFSDKGTKYLAVELVTLIDLFLLGTVLYIVSVGLYTLFIDANVPMPAWLRITTIDDLKERLLGVVSVLLAVTFLGNAVPWQGGTEILSLGLAIAAVLAAVGLLLSVLSRTHAAHADGTTGLESGKGVIHVGHDASPALDEALADRARSGTPSASGG
jgi:uncharacterized membrane protein YqhA